GAFNSFYCIPILSFDFVLLILTAEEGFLSFRLIKPEENSMVIMGVRSKAHYNSSPRQIPW
ncbi:MAG: hypothetical protein QXM08_05970, partial [Thermofilaceae archaeon]